MRTILLLYCFLLVAVKLIAGAEQEPYAIQHYTDENGLPQNSVKFIMPDEYGFLWAATENGVARFDGRQFATFNGNVGLQNSRIQYVFPETGGKGSIARTISEEEISISGGKAVLVPRSGNFSYIFNNDPSKAYPITGFRNDVPDLDASHYLIPVDAHRYFRITKDTVRYIVSGRERYRITYPDIDPRRTFTQDAALCYMDGNGRFLLLDSSGVHPLQWEGALPPPLPRAANTAGEPLIYWNFAAGQQFLYTGGACYKIVLINRSVIRATLILEGFDVREQAIMSIYYDSTYRKVFLGSQTKGLFICTSKQFRAFRAEKVQNEVFYAQAIYGAGNIITPGGTVFNRKGRVGRLSLLDSVWTNDKYSIARDVNGNYWYKSYRRLIKLSADLTKVLWSGATDEEINVLYPDSTGRLWIGTTKSGLFFLQTADPHPQIRPFLPSLKNISYILRQGQALWTGTEKGLYRIHLLSRDIDTISGLENLYIRSLHIPGSGELWITTYSNGIFLYKSGRLTNLPLDSKKYMATAHCVIPDENGFLWVTTNKGLFQLSHKDAMAYEKGESRDLFYLYYGKDQGFNTNEFNGGCEPCAVKLPNGDISLPSIDGLVYFTPGSIRQDLPDKQIFIEAAELDARPVEIDSSISLPNEFHHLRLYVSTPYFGDPNNLRLYYSLAGEADKGELWLQVNDNRSIEFSSLHSGKYILKVRKIAGFGPDRITETTFVIDVQKAFYEKPWFLVLGILVLVLLVLVFFMLLVGREKSKNRVLELRVMERTGKLKETLNNLQLSEQQLRRQGFIQQRLTAAMSHDLKTPLRYMMQVLREGQAEHSALDKDERNVVYESLYNMFHLVENLISYMKSQYLSDDSSLEITDLYKLLEEKARIFKKVSEAKGVSIINDAQPGTVVLVNRQLLAVVLHNLLDNAVKYTRKGYIRISACCDKENIYIGLVDTGIGMPPVLVTWINEYQKGISVTERRPPSYDGIGLLMVMELLQLINGTIVVSSNNGSGTAINITLGIIE